MPDNESKRHENLWCSFDYGFAHFVIINIRSKFPNVSANSNTRLHDGNFATDEV